MENKKESNLLLFSWSLVFLFLPLQIPFLGLKNEYLNTFWQNIFNLFSKKQVPLFSDSEGFVWILSILLVVSGVVYILFRKTFHAYEDTVHNFLRKFLVICLFLVFVKYGLDKVMLLQFPSPEPNILFTPLGELDKDILFWTSMGTSRLFNWVSGGLEIIGAISLLFYRTRRVGLMLLFLSATYIVLLNFSFNIGVKFFSLFLFFTLLTLNWTTLSFLFSYFLGFGEEKDTSKDKRIYLPLLKLVFAGSILAFLVQQNQENTFSNSLQGAYINQGNSELKYVFINQQNYWMERLKNGDIKSFEIMHQGKKALSLQSDEGEKREIEFYSTKSKTFILNNGSQLLDTFQKIDLSKANALQDDFTLIVR
jgi:hypothetical protein